MKFNKLYVQKDVRRELGGEFSNYDDDDGIRKITAEDIKNPDLEHSSHN